VNASLPDRESELKSCRAGIEEAFRSLLEAAARLVQGSGDAAQARALADSLRSALADGRRYAAAYADNNLASHSDYFLRYIMMREAEFSVLEELLGQAEKAGGAQGCEAACAYLRGCAQRVSAESDLTEDRRLLTQLRDTLGQLPMPAGRAEFLRQAALFACADSLHEMVSIKESFVDSLSDEQRRRYWAAAE
jgi:uncharacterized membrane protein YgaE (UPF0421/DUF939 family)